MQRRQKEKGEIEKKNVFCSTNISNKDTLEKMGGHIKGQNNIKTILLTFLNR